MGIVCRTHGDLRNAYILVRNPKRKRPLRKPKHRWDDDIKMGLKKTRCYCMRWIHLSQDSVQDFRAVKL
jgi:hypothetical protein